MILRHMTKGAQIVPNRSLLLKMLQVSNRKSLIGGSGAEECSKPELHDTQTGDSLRSGGQDRTDAQSDGGRHLQENGGDYETFVGRRPEVEHSPCGGFVPDCLVCL